MAVTPMMKQYEEAKRACPDALLLFRMGDFYEMFHDDAKTAARVLNLALTSREKGENAMPMAGFPHHQLESYLGKLIAAGMRAAVCEQVEDPKLAKGLVRREVTRIVTPGTVTDDALLDPRESNFLAAVAPGDPVGLAWVELSTGPFVAAGFSAGQLADQLARIAPAECLLATTPPPLPAQLERADDGHPPPGVGVFRSRPPGRRWPSISARPAWKVLASPTARPTPRRSAPPAPILDYLAETQKSSLAHIDRLLPYRASGTLEIDEASRRSLEITPHHPRRPPRGLAAVGARSHGHGDGLAAAGRVGGQSAVRRGGRSAHGSTPSRSCVGDQALCDDLHENLAARLRRGAAAGPGDHRPGQPARPEFLGPHAAVAAGGEGETARRGGASCSTRTGGRHRSLSRAARDARSGVGRRLSAGQPRGRLHPRRLQRRAGRACASWPTAASSGSPATRPRRPSGRASRA